MTWKDLLKNDKGLGDTIARATDYVGIKKCGGCAKRQKKLNKLVKYRGVPTNALTCEKPGCNRASIVWCRHHDGGLCKYHYGIEVDLDNWTESGIHRWIPIEDDLDE